MHRLVEWTAANVEWIIAAVTMAASLVGLAYVLFWDRRLLGSPICWLVLGASAATAVAAGAAGLFESANATDPKALSWVFHLALMLDSNAVLSGIAVVTAVVTRRSVPDLVERFRLLHRFVATAPLGIGSGYAVGTLVLFFAPTPTISVVWDLSPWAFFYRGCVQLPALLYALAMCILMIRLRLAFGEPRDATQAACKNRFSPAAAGAAVWSLSCINHLCWPLAAVLWPASDLGSGYDRYLEALRLPLLASLVLPYLTLFLLPYRPSCAYRFARYVTLTENFGLQANGPWSRHWRFRYRWSRAARLIELASEDLGLAHSDRARAVDAYKVVAVTKAAALPPRRWSLRPWHRRAATAAKTIAVALDEAVSTGTPQAAAVPKVPRFLTRDEVKELNALHATFLGEPAGSPHRGYSLQNRWAPLIPEALLLTDESPVPDLGTYPRYFQLTVAVAADAGADAGLFPPKQSSTILDPSVTPIDRRTFEAYEHARDIIDGRKAS